MLNIRTSSHLRNIKRKFNFRVVIYSLGNEKIEGLASLKNTLAHGDKVIAVLCMTKSIKTLQISTRTSAFSGVAPDTGQRRLSTRPNRFR